MSKNLAGDTSGEIVKQSVRPFHLAKIDFATTGTVTISEGQQVTFAGYTFLADNLMVGSFRWGSDGSQTVEIQLPDYDGSAVSLALNNKIADTPVTLWLAYSTGPGLNDYTTPVKLAVGVLNPKDISEDGVTFEVVRINSDSEYYPNTYCTQTNGFNYLMKAGSKVSWGAEIWEVPVS